MPIKYDDKHVLRPGHKVDFTREMIHELNKCATDITYFAENYFTVVHPTKGRKKLCDIEGLYDFQKEMITNFSQNRFNIVLSARQMGKCLEKQQFVDILDKETEKVMRITIKEFLNLCSGAQ